METVFEVKKAETIGSKSNDLEIKIVLYTQDLDALAWYGKFVKKQCIKVVAEPYESSVNSEVIDLWVHSQKCERLFNFSFGYFL